MPEALSCDINLRRAKKRQIKHPLCKGPAASVRGMPAAKSRRECQPHSATHYQNCDISHTADWEHKYKKKPHIRAQSLKGLRDWEHKTFILTGKCSQSAEPQSKINLDIQNSFPKFVTHSIIHQSARVEG